MYLFYLVWCTSGQPPRGGVGHVPNIFTAGWWLVYFTEFRLRNVCKFLLTDFPQSAEFTNNQVTVGRNRHGFWSMLTSWMQRTKRMLPRQCNKCNRCDSSEQCKAKDNVCILTFWSLHCLHQLLRQDKKIHKQICNSEQTQWHKSCPKRSLHCIVCIAFVWCIPFVASAACIALHTLPVAFIMLCVCGVCCFRSTILTLQNSVLNSTLLFLQQKFRKLHIFKIPHSAFHYVIHKIQNTQNTHRLTFSPHFLHSRIWGTSKMTAMAQ